MRLVFVRGWIVPHLLLASVMLFMTMALPRLWPRFRVETPSGRGLVAVAFGTPSIVLMLRWAIEVDLRLAPMRYSPPTPTEIYLKWGVQGLVLLTLFLAAVVYLLRLVRVADRFSFGVLWAVIVIASLVTMYGTHAPQSTASEDVVAPRF